MKKKFKYTIFLCLIAVAFIYISLVSYLWWSEYSLDPIKTDLHTVYTRSKLPHKITLIDDGHSSLYERVKLIQNAKKRIELEFFIYELDLASKLITNKLIEAAERGVDVRLMVDFSAPVFKLGPIYAQYLNTHGVKVKYYNTVDTTSYIRVQHRSHRKFLIIDDQYVVTGGRNIGNDYFNLSDSYNFLDSDILIEGPIVKKIRKSFDDYWQSNQASQPILEDHNNQSAKSFFKNRVKEYALLDKLNSNKNHLKSLPFSSTCNDLTFITDYPGLDLSNRQVYKRLSNFLKEANSSIYAESPYFVLKNDGIKLLKDLADKGIHQTYYTNSLVSTDAFYTVSAMIYSLPSLQDKNIDVSIYNGEGPTYELALESKTKRWGIHSKRAVVDNKHTIIGTYNIDPRSANLNSEVLLICRDNTELAEYMRNNISSRHKNSLPVLKGEESNYSNIIKNSSLKQKFLFFLSLPLAKAFDFLL